MPDAVSPDAVSDVSATVDYSVDKTVMDRIPIALAGVALGLAYLFNTEARGTNAALVAVVYLALVGLAFAGWAVTRKNSDARIRSPIDTPVRGSTLRRSIFHQRTRTRCPRRARLPSFLPLWQ